MRRYCCKPVFVDSRLIVAGWLKKRNVVALLCRHARRFLPGQGGKINPAGWRHCLVYPGSKSMNVRLVYAPVGVLIVCGDSSTGPEMIIYRSNHTVSFPLGTFVVPFQICRHSSLIQNPLVVQHEADA